MIWFYYSVKNGNSAISVAIDPPRSFYPHSPHRYNKDTLPTCVTCMLFFSAGLAA